MHKNKQHSCQANRIAKGKDAKIIILLRLRQTLRGNIVLHNQQITPSLLYLNEGTIQCSTLKYQGKLAVFSI